MAPLMLNSGYMMIIVSIILGFAAVGVVLGVLVAKTAPVGYQDANGFHFGAEPSAQAFEVRRVKAA